MATSIENPQSILNMVLLLFMAKVAHRLAFPLVSKAQLQWEVAGWQNWGAPETTSAQRSDPSGSTGQQARIPETMLCTILMSYVYDVFWALELRELVSGNGFWDILSKGYGG